MKMKVLFCSPRSVTVKLADGRLYATEKAYRLTLNGQEAGAADTVITSLYGLWPDTKYHLQAWDGDALLAEAEFRTEEESFTMNVRQFGAVGDGVHDDTAAIQAAITCCPKKGRVLIPAGAYRVKPLFLKSHIRLELQKGATLQLERDRSLFPILPGMIQSTDEESDFNLGTWEGNPLDMFGSLFTGVDVKDVVIYGQGIADGMAPDSDWWVTPRIKRGAWRPRLLYLCRCENVTVQGITFRNSPAWNLHPYFSNELKFLNISVQAPANSPNTDGFDPESCKGILVAGAHFSLGDDCIAIKAGKLYMGATYATPCEDIEIINCLMEDGHGGVTVGSEMAGGVKHVRVKDCLMRNTDRGLRVKTRRGRGKNGVIDDIVFDHVEMEQVGTPFVVNCLYYCDPDGHTEYVQSLEKQPVDDRTPYVGSVTFRQVNATGVSCAGYFLGLPEQPIKHVTMEQVNIACAPDAAPMQPAMADCVPKCVCKGIVASDVEKMTLKNVQITGYEGERIEARNVKIAEE
ncbi:MAG: glycoside hydrolase family 28 protein [Clostridia bacterium]|nr:glycoside hydrolase family 28 protein [Clostridia bacterium]